MHRRIASLWFPHLAAERVLRREGRSDPTRPFAVVTMQKSALRLCSMNEAAKAAGLRLGATLTDVRAIYPDLLFVQEQPEKDAALLHALARWSVQYTPSTELDENDGLFLDIAGSAHLFGGEAALLELITAQLDDMGLTVRIGLADTKGAAWALARFASPPRIAPIGSTREAVTCLPVAALRIEESAVLAFNRLGLRVIGDIIGMPRGALARRFGEHMVQRLDRLLGAEPDLLSLSALTPPYAVRLSLPEPIGKTDDVVAALGRLLARLCERLAQDQRGARQMRFSIQRTDHSEETIEIGLASPSRDPKQISSLFDHAINGMDAGFGIDAVRLHAFVTEPLKPEQSAPLGRETQDQSALNDLIGRIGNRIGFDRVTRFLPAESHVPERAFTVAAAAYSKPEHFPQGGRDRPLTLFGPEPLRQLVDSTPPTSFRWRGGAFNMQEAIGPERIAPEWWWDDPNWRSGVRDYWKVQTTEGRRLWLFHAKGGDMPAGWFVQGEFA